MERLTDKNDVGSYYYPKCFEKCGGLGASGKCNNCEIMTSVCQKLGDYEDLEEQGRLIKLPCKVGDIVYVNDVLGCGEVERYKVIRVDYHSTLGTGRNEFYIEALLCTNPDKSIAFYDKQFGKTVFLTKSEAEARLKELRGN